MTDLSSGGGGNMNEQLQLGSVLLLSHLEVLFNFFQTEPGRNSEKSAFRQVSVRLFLVHVQPLLNLL